MDALRLRCESWRKPKLVRELACGGYLADGINGSVHRAARRRLDHAGGQPGPGRSRYRASGLLHHQSRLGGRLPQSSPRRTMGHHHAVLLRPGCAQCRRSRLPIHAGYPCRRRTPPRCSTGSYTEASCPPSQATATGCAPTRPKHANTDREEAITSLNRPPEVATFDDRLWDRLRVISVIAISKRRQLSGRPQH